MVLDQQEQLSLKELLSKPSEANFIAFNGTIDTDFTEVGGGYIAFQLTAGTVTKKEMPLILLKGEKAEVEKELHKGDRISAFGTLDKIQGEWVIITVQCSRVLEDDELNNLK